jgi:hypothetical protein
MMETPHIDKEKLVNCTAVDAVQYGKFSADYSSNPITS